MAENIARLISDTYHKQGAALKFSDEENKEVIHNALLELTHGKTKLSYKDVRDGKYNGLFTIMEEVIEENIVEGLQGNELFMNLVEERNIPKGDMNEFIVEKDVLFKVSEVASGTQGIRRQRLNKGEKFSVKTTYKAIKFYEEMNRVLAGAIDTNKMIELVSRSYTQDTLQRIFNLWNSLTEEKVGGKDYYSSKGSFDEVAFMTLIDHVEAANGARATIYGTKQALRQAGMQNMAETAKQDLYNTGYFGKFYGTDIVCMDQRHEIGSSNFLIDANKLWVIASDDKPIKHVIEGEPIIVDKNFLDNADFTQDYLYLLQDGYAWIAANKLGVYELPASA